MSTRVVERVAEELAAVGAGSGAYICALTRHGHGIEHERERAGRAGEVSTELALLIAEDEGGALWCATCRASVEAGAQLKNHRRIGHRIEWMTMTHNVGAGLGGAL